MFLLNSCLSLFSAACIRRHPFSRSYGVILPNSLTMLLPSALGFSPHPPVSVYGTGTYNTIAAFLGTWLTRFATYVRSTSRPSLRKRTSLLPSLTACTGLTITLLRLSYCVTASLKRSSVVQESPPAVHRLRPSVLGLGPDLPWADEPSPGNLRFSTAQILTVLSLLIPAFSLVFRPPPLPIRLLPTAQRSSTNALLHSIASAIRFSPVISSAHHHSTSELLRTL